jgi:hypothetical protein
MEFVFPIGEAPENIHFGGDIYRRDYSAEMVGVPAKKGWPLECIASGVNANQRGELETFLREKGVPTEVSKDGNPIYRDPNHRRKALKARNFVDKASFI